MDWARARVRRVGGFVARHTSNTTACEARRHFLIAVAAAWLGLSVVSIAPAADSLGDAQRMLLAGKYAEAEEVFAKTAAAEPVDSALGLARCQAAVGEYDKAVATLAAALKDHAKEAALPAELAKLAFERSQYDEAAKQVAAALKLDENQLAARFYQAELARVAGKLTDADRGYKWFVEYYNQHDLTEPDDIRYVGLAAAQFARWNRLSDQFSFLINDLYPEALQLDPGYWPARYESGCLLLEKYNQGEAAKEFKAGLLLNSNSAELHAALASLAIQNFELTEAQAELERALEINPKLLVARQLQADIHLANIEPQKAVEVLKGALLLHPTHEETLGRLAAAFAALDGQQGEGSRCGKIIAEVTARNPKAGEFYLTLGDSFDRLRRYPPAAQYYRVAVEKMPQLATARGQLGMTLMRLGEETEAKKLLDESFESDPFNVRVSNTLKVLEVLDGYATLETPHFIIRYDAEKDKITARYAARWLEEIYPQLCQQLGFEPPEKSLFEIFNKAKNTDGHGWFSARMVGLPSIHTIGACAGKIVAMQSPNDGKQRFNWARVLKHEFVHVVNLQQTNFNIPHWYTEALAVLNENQKRPQAWNDLLAERLPAGKTFNLDTINLGFIRPHSSNDWTMAYCQAELYAEYMVERFGPDSLSKMLSAYADNLSTAEALRRSFNVEQPEFEKGYREHLEKVVAGLRPGKKAAAEKPQTFAQLQKALAADPENADKQAALAQGHLDRKAYPEARKLAEGVLAKQPKHQLANYVKARVHMVVGENKEALALLEAALDPADPQENLLGLLAGLRLKAEDYAQAARLYELGQKNSPSDLKWTKSLAAVYLKSMNQQKLAEQLAKLADEDGDDLTVRRKLTELAIAAKDYPATARWATEALQIDVLDAALHRMLAEALIGQGKPADAAFEYETAVELIPDSGSLRYALADAYLQAKDTERAKAALKTLLEKEPDYPGAKALLEGL